MYFVTPNQTKDMQDPKVGTQKSKKTGKGFLKMENQRTKSEYKTWFEM